MSQKELSRQSSLASTKSADSDKNKPSKPRSQQLPYRFVEATWGSLLNLNVEVVEEPTKQVTGGIFSRSSPAKFPTPTDEQNPDEEFYDDEWSEQKVQREIQERFAGLSGATSRNELFCVPPKERCASYLASYKEFVESKNFNFGLPEFREKFAACSIPGTNWKFVRPINQHEELRSKKGFVLPFLLESTLAILHNADTNVYHWSKDGPKEIVEMPAVKLLREDHLYYEETLLELMLQMAADEDIPNVPKLLESEAIVGKEQEQQVLNYYKSLPFDIENPKNAFIYMLLDPREMPMPPQKAATKFHHFMNSIFYIGRTSRSDKNERPFEHLSKVAGLDASKISRDFGSSHKKGRIREIWTDKDKKGVINLQLCFPIYIQEAIVRESAMIKTRMTTCNEQFLTAIERAKRRIEEAEEWYPEAKAKNADWSNKVIGPVDLTNKREEKIDYNTRAMHNLLSAANLRALGVRFLLRAFGVYLNERCCEVYERDIKSVDTGDEQSQAGSEGGSTTPQHLGTPSSSPAIGSKRKDSTAGAKPKKLLKPEPGQPPIFGYLSSGK